MALDGVADHAGEQLAVAEPRDVVVGAEFLRGRDPSEVAERDDGDAGGAATDGGDGGGDVGGPVGAAGDVGHDAVPRLRGEPGRRVGGGGAGLDREAPVRGECVGQEGGRAEAAPEEEDLQHAVGGLPRDRSHGVPIGRSAQRWMPFGGGGLRSDHARARP